MKNSKRFHRLIPSFILAIFLAGAILPALATASDYPRKPITVVVPWPAGSATGIVGQKLVNIILEKKLLAQPLQIVYKPGAAGTIGLAEVVTGKADGYTLAYNPSAPILVQPLVKELPYTHKTMVPIIQTAKFPWLIAVKSDGPWKTIQDVLEHAKKHPGELMVGTAGDFTWPHLSLIQISQATGLKFRHVPFQGSTPNKTALLGGHIHVGFLAAGDVAAEVAAGKIKIIATLETERSSFAPDAPTFKELGHPIRGTIFTHILVAPKDAPMKAVETIHDAYKKAVETEDFKSFLKQIGGSPGYASDKELPGIIDEAVKEIVTLLEGIGAKIRKPQ